MAGGDDEGSAIPDRITLAAFALAVALAGGNSVAIRYISCESCELAPFWSAALRFLLAALVFALIALGLGVGMPRGRALLGAVVYGTLQFGGGFGLVYWGLVHAPAGLSQVLLACVPLITFALALAQRQERFRWDRLVGAASAVGGIAIIFSTGLDAGVPLASMLAIFAGAFCFAEALIIVKGFPAVHPAAMNAVGMGIGTAILLAVGIVFDEPINVPETGSTWVALVYLVTAGSVGVFWSVVFLVRRWSASAVSYQLVLIPVVTIVLSAWLQDERITPTFVGGSILVMVGAYVGALRRPSAR